MTKKNTQQLAARLRAEAERYHALAKDAALKALVNYNNTEHGTLARQHLIRAETYREAAALVEKEAA